MSNESDMCEIGLKELITDLQRKKLSKSEAGRRFSAYHRKQFNRMLEKVATNEVSIEDVPYPGNAANIADHDNFCSDLKRIDDDLGELIRIVQEGVSHYFENGEYPAPYYAWRIAIILRKRKMHQEEADFLDAFSRLFSDGNGTRYEQIAKRSVKAREIAEKHKHRIKAQSFGKRRATPPKAQPTVELPADLESLPLNEVEKILNNRDYTKVQLIELGAKRFGISRSELSRRGRDGVLYSINVALENDRTLNIIAQEAHRVGTIRSA